MNHRAPTQRQIADKIGVSQATVAMVLGAGSAANAGRVSSAMKEKILQVAAELGYRPQRHAQLMKGISSRTLGIISPVTLQQSTVEKYYHLSEAAKRAGFSIFSQDLVWVWEPTAQENLLNNMLDARVEGLILLMNNVRFPVKAVQNVRKAGIPIVCMGGRVIPSVPHIEIDCIHAARLVVQHAIACGTRRFALECGRKGWPILNELIPAFQKAFAEAGILPRDVKLIQARDPSIDFDRFESGSVAAAVLAESGKLPTTLICLSAHTAVGAMHFLRQNGLNVPGDVPVICLDDSALCKKAAVPITSLAAPVSDMAYTAVDLVLGQLEDKFSFSSRRKIRMQPSLIVRRSCGSTDNPSEVWSLTPEMFLSCDLSKDSAAIIKQMTGDPVVPSPKSEPQQIPHLQ